MLIIYLLTIGIFFSMFFSIDQDTSTLVFLPFSYRQGLVIGITFLLGVIAFIPSLTSYYYVVENKYFIMKKYGKEYQFDYANIEFLDIEESKRKEMVIFYSSKGGMRYLLGDKIGVLLDTLIKKCQKNIRPLWWMISSIFWLSPT